MKLIDLVKLGRMLRITKVRTYQNLTFTISENINTTFYYFTKIHNTGIMNDLEIVNLDFQYYPLIYQAFMELIKFTKVYNTGLLIAMY